MKRIILAVVALAAFAVLTSASALASTTDLELVSGSDILFFDGTTLTCTGGTCASFGAVASTNVFGQLSITATSFNGWSIVNSTGGSNTPGCSGLAGPGCVSTDDINASTAGSSSALLAFFGSTGFGAEPNLFVTESGSAVTNGTATAQGFAYAGALGFSALAAPTLSGQIGSTLSLSAAGTAGPTGAPAPGAPFNLAIANDFATGVNAAYNVDTTITAAEPASASLLLLVLAAGSLVVLGRRQLGAV